MWRGSLCSLEMKAEKKKRKASHDGRVHPGNLARNWLHQALTYMDRGELTLRLVTELGEVVILWALMAWLFEMPVDRQWILLGVSGLAVHTFNWITNANFWALLLFALPGMRNRGDAATCAYLNRMADRLHAHSSIAGLALFGSVARNVWHERSDIDARIIRRPGFGNLVAAFLLTMRERWLAVVNRQPLDLFLADDVTFLRRMRSDEQPLFLLKRGEDLEQAYPRNVPGKLDGLQR